MHYTSTQLRHYTRFILVLCWLIASFSTHTVPITSVFLPRTEGYYNVHYLRPYDDYKIRCEQPAILSSILGYFRSEKPDAIAQALFGSSRLTFSGSEVLNRNPSTDLRADDFGLAPNFIGTLSLAPRIETVMVDFSYRFNLTSRCMPFFVELGAPLIYTRWHLDACEHIIQPGILTFPPCEVTGTPGTPNNTASSIKEALSGNFLFGDMKVPWYNGRFVFETQEKTRLADISCALGVDFYQSDPCTLTGAILTLMPTGNHYSPRTVFSPMIGSSNHWELGAFLRWNGQYVWNENHTFDGYIMGTFTHLFDNQQRRTFDFRDKGPLSRYLLLKELNVVADDMGNNTFVYNNTLINAVNFTTRRVEVACALQGDIVFQASYKTPHVTIDGGYTLYGRTKEHIKLNPYDIPRSIQGNFYAVKGTTGTCYRLYDDNGTAIITTEEVGGSLNTSQAATMYNTGAIDLPVPIPTTSTELALTWNSNNNNNNIIGQTVIAITGAPDFQSAESSAPPRLLSCSDFDLNSAAAPSCVIHTLFIQAGYHWVGPCMEPTLMIGVGQMCGRYGSQNALYQWGAWIHFNAQF